MALLRKHIQGAGDDQLREMVQMMAETLIIAAFVIIVDIVLRAFVPDIARQLGPGGVDRLVERRQRVFAQKQLDAGERSAPFLHLPRHEASLSRPVPGNYGANGPPSCGR